MILDSLTNAGLYEHLHPAFEQAFACLRQTDFREMADGRYEIDGSRLYFAIATIDGKEKQQALIETHIRYIDIQMPLLGIEKIGWKSANDLTELSVPYNEATDITFYSDRPTAFTKIHPGQFAVYFPKDGHAPGISREAIRKVVVKILL